MSEDQDGGVSVDQSSSHATTYLPDEALVDDRSQSEPTAQEAKKTRARKERKERQKQKASPTHAQPELPAARDDAIPPQSPDVKHIKQIAQDERKEVDRRSAKPSQKRAKQNASTPLPSNTPHAPLAFRSRPPATPPISWPLIQSARGQVQPSAPPPRDQQVRNLRSQAQPKAHLASRSRDPKMFVLPRPQPTQDYLDRARQEPRASSKPRQLLVILDLNGTLIHRNSRSHNAQITRRPFCDAFIKYVMSEHKVMIWSSAREHNVERMCRLIFGDAGLALPPHRWHRGNFNLKAEHFGMNVQLYKQLSWIWTDYNIARKQCEEGMFDQSNTVLIDDSVEKAFSEPYNLVRVDEYDGTDQTSDVLGKVVEYLELARRTEDVSAFIYSKPFGFNKADVPYAWPPETSVRSATNPGSSESIQKQESAQSTR